MSTPIEKLHLPNRLYFALLSAGIGTVEDLAQLSRDELMQVPRVGVEYARVVESALGERGLALADSPTVV